MLDGGIILPNQTINNLNISTDSAKNIVEVLKPLFERPLLDKYAVIIALFASIASLAIAIAAVIAAFKSSKIAHNSLKNEVLKLFFDISFSLPKGKTATLSTHHKQLICNYFDFVCTLLLRKELKARDIDLLFSVMKEKQFVNYAKNYRKSYGNDYFKYYWKWLHK